MDFSYHSWILRTLRTMDYSYHSRTFRTIAEQWREHETRRRWRQAIDSPYGLMKASDRRTDGRAIAYSALSIYAICSRALIKPLNTHADLIDAVNKTDPTPVSASSELLLLNAHYVRRRRLTQNWRHHQLDRRPYRCRHSKAVPACCPTNGLQ